MVAILEKKGYDLVNPSYDQDRLNGFDKKLIDSFIKLGDLDPDNQIIDAMGGNGNLSQRIMELFPKADVKCIDISEVQIEKARSEGIKAYAFNICEKIPFEEQDTVYLKSGWHELRNYQKAKAFKNIQKSLKPGGSFIGLGFLFPTEELRNDFLRISITKDSLAGLTDLVINREYPTEQEMTDLLSDAGFRSIKYLKSPPYKISSNQVSDCYFKGNEWKTQIFQEVVKGTRAISKEQIGGDLLIYANSSMIKAEK